jgi:hypothetical protein
MPKHRETAKEWMSRVGHLPAPRLGDEFYFPKAEREEVGFLACWQRNRKDRDLKAMDVKG